MTAKQFITNIKASFALKDIDEENKKKSLQALLVKLTERKMSIINSLETSLEKQKFQEELNIISLHIKKGEKLLDDLSSHQQ